MATVDPTVPTDSRRRHLLEVALAVFARHGYRKTSMDDVAHAAEVSRQGLYLYFPSKEDLFRETVLHALQQAQTAATAILSTHGCTLEDRLVGAFDAWLGRFFEARGADVAELVSACHTLLGPTIDERKREFADCIAAALTAAGLVACYRPLGLTAEQLAASLCATADGLKGLHTSRPAFVEGIRTAVRILCLPLARPV
jgi:AcrR family transcriptional regulator